MAAVGFIYCAFYLFDGRNVCARKVLGVKEDV